MVKKTGKSVRRNKQVKDSEPQELSEAPHSFVIHRGLPGDHIGELTKDFRKLMEPFTATALKERKKNSIKDFVSVSGLFHVTNICIFSRTEHGLYYRLAHLPRGPTLSFKIHSFTLARDVMSSLKKQLIYDQAFMTPPLVVLNNFSGEGMHMKLMATMFQNMFPAINLTTVKLSTIRRCLLLNYNSQSKLIDLRHYIIKVAPTGISKAVKKVVQGKVPDLSKFDDIAEFITKAGILSESEVDDDPSCQVTLPQKLPARGTSENSLSAIRLSEIGPRLTLQLIKVEEGLCNGEVLFHEIVHKTEEEIRENRKRRKAKEKLKLQRKRIQEENKKKKQGAEENSDNEPEKSEKPKKKKQVRERDAQIKKATDEAFEIIRSNTVDDDDEEYYRDEVGQEPDRDLFDKNINRSKRFSQSNSKTFSQKRKFDGSSSFNQMHGGAKRAKYDDDNKKKFGPKDHPNGKHGKNFHGKSNKNKFKSENNNFRGNRNGGRQRHDDKPKKFKNSKQKGNKHKTRKM